MSSLNITPISLHGPEDGGSLQLNFKAVSSVSHNITWQLSLAAGNGHEVFLERLTMRDLEKIDDDERYAITVPGESFPRFKSSAGSNAVTEVALHAWKGERLLGKWTFGQVSSLGV